LVLTPEDLLVRLCAAAEFAARHLNGTLFEADLPLENFEATHQSIFSSASASAEGSRPKTRTLLYENRWNCYLLRGNKRRFARG
jgi:hypothetical protein